MGPHHASGLLLLLSTAALGCDSGDDGSDTDTGTTSGSTSGSVTTGEPAETTTGSSGTTSAPGTSSSSEGSSSSGSGSSSSGSTGNADTGTTTGGTALCNEHGNVVEKCTDASYEYGVGYCEYAIAAGEDYSADCGEAWEALFGCINGVECKDFGIEGVPGCEAEEEKLDSLCSK